MIYFTKLDLLFRNVVNNLMFMATIIYVVFSIHIVFASILTYFEIGLVQCRTQRDM